MMEKRSSAEYQKHCGLHPRGAARNFAAQSAVKSSA